MAACPSICSDPFYGTRIQPPYEDLFVTDGSWIWNRTVAYWVEFYLLRLPSDFLKHMRQASFRIPAKPQTPHESASKALRRLNAEEAFTVAGG